ncbi:MAG: LacI family DNA-binding transcriptional regulator [Candidatus Dormiibacterota bacterium]
MEKKLVTLTMVAARASVSLATASRVLSGGARVVGADLAQRVLVAAEELGYVPNAHAQALAAGRNPALALIVHDVGDPYFAAIADGALRAANSLGRMMIVACTYRDPDREVAYVRMMHQQRTDAIILAGSGYRERVRTKNLQAALAAYRTSGGRVAMISQHHVDADAVLPDNRRGASAITRAMLELGHRSFAVMTGPDHLLTVRDRFLGTHSQLTRAGVELPPANIVDGGFTREGGAAAVERLLASGTLAKVTCLLILSDVMALGSMHALHAHGIRVPDQLSVAGFDDIPAVRDLTPALTTVHLPLEEMGATALRLATKGSETAPREPELVHVPATVVLRESTAGPGMTTPGAATPRARAGRPQRTREEVS